MEIAYSIDIDATPKTIFTYMCFPGKPGKQVRSALESKNFPETPEGVGDAFQEMMESDDNDLRMQGAVTEYVPEQVIAFRMESKIHRMAVRYSVEPQLRNTRLLVNSTIDIKFPLNLVSWFFKAKMKAEFLAELQGECAELKRLCETGFA